VQWNVRHGQAKRTELVFLPFTVVLPQPASLAMGDGAGDAVPPLATVKLSQRAPALGFVIDVHAGSGLADLNLICKKREPTPMKCEPAPSNASSPADNVSMTAPSVAVNSSRHRRRMRARSV
jgi:hypothetical protein